MRLLTQEFKFTIIQTKWGETVLSIAMVNSRDWCCYEDKVVPLVPFKATNNTNVNGNKCTELFVHCTYTLHVVEKIHISK